MKYDRKQLIKQTDKVKFLFFWGHRPSKNGQVTASCFSQWWEQEFTVDGITYKSAEHWMMAKKAELFGDHEVKEKILASKTPGEAKKWGRKVKGFKSELWDEMKYAIVLAGNISKFEQNPELKEFLLNTGDQIIVEASPVDPIWGIGLAADDEAAQFPERWKGENLLGFALMETRDKLKK